MISTLFLHINKPNFPIAEIGVNVFQEAKIKLNDFNNRQLSIQNIKIRNKYKKKKQVFL